MAATSSPQYPSASVQHSLRPRKKRLCSHVPLRNSAIIIGGLQVASNAGEICCGCYDIARSSAVRLQFAFAITSLIVSTIALALALCLLIGILKDNLLLVRIWQCMVLFLVVLDLVICGYVLYILVTYQVQWLYIAWFSLVIFFVVVACVGLFLVNSYILVKTAEEEELQRIADMEARAKREWDRERRRTKTRAMKGSL